MHNHAKLFLGDFSFIFFFFAFHLKVSEETYYAVNMYKEEFINLIKCHGILLMPCHYLCVCVFVCKSNKQ